MSILFGHQGQLTSDLQDKTINENIADNAVTFLLILHVLTKPARHVNVITQGFPRIFVLITLKTSKDTYNQNQFTLFFYMDTYQKIDPPWHDFFMFVYSSVTKQQI